MNGLVCNMVGGGGGILAGDAVLRVQAPAGSVVTISKGGVSRSDNGHENALTPTMYDYYFVIHASQFDSVNPWSVTAALSPYSKTQTIIIDSADGYDLLFPYYRIYLYNRGTVNTDFTGGFTSSGYQYPSGTSLSAPTFGASAIRFTDKKGTGTVNKIDLTYFDTAYFVAKGNSTYPKQPLLRASSSKDLQSGNVASTTTDGTTENTASMDISSLSGEYYIAVFTSTTGADGYAYEVYLE